MFCNNIGQPLKSQTVTQQRMSAGEEEVYSEDFSSDVESDDELVEPFDPLRCIEKSPEQTPSYVDRITPKKYAKEGHETMVLNLSQQAADLIKEQRKEKAMRRMNIITAILIIAVPITIIIVANLIASYKQETYVKGLELFPKISDINDADLQMYLGLMNVHLEYNPDNEQALFLKYSILEKLDQPEDAQVVIRHLHELARIREERAREEIPVTVDESPLVPVTSDESPIVFRNN
jgi:hypothetical protein